jgi:hypothetical protein
VTSDGDERVAPNAVVRTRSERQRITRQHARSTMAMQEPILTLAKLLDVVPSGRLSVAPATASKR